MRSDRVAIDNVVPGLWLGLGLLIVPSALASLRLAPFLRYTSRKKTSCSPNCLLGLPRRSRSIFRRQGLAVPPLGTKISCEEPIPFFIVREKYL